MMHRRKHAFLAAFLMCGGASVLFCQTQTGQVTGTVSDPQSSAVPGAQVTVTNVATQVARTAESNATGNYLVTNLLPGSYQVEVTKEGFQRSLSQVFTLDVNQSVTIDVRLQVGAVSQTVNVSAEATLLAASSAQLGTVVTEEKILDLPLNARNFTELLTFTPGAAPVSVGQNSGGGPVQKIGTFVFPAMNGQTNRSNAFRLDGVYNDAHWQNTYAVAPNIDALTQFKVQSHSDQAEFGGVAGGIVNIASKSGTNAFHGTGYEFFRNDALDARILCCPQTGTPAKPVRRNPGRAGAEGQDLLHVLLRGLSADQRKFDAVSGPHARATEW